MKEKSSILINYINPNMCYYTYEGDCEKGKINWSLYTDGIITICSKESFNKATIPDPENDYRLLWATDVSVNYIDIKKAHYVLKVGKVNDIICNECLYTIDVLDTSTIDIIHDKVKKLVHKRSS